MISNWIVSDGTCQITQPLPIAVTSYARPRQCRANTTHKLVNMPFTSRCTQNWWFCWMVHQADPLYFPFVSHARNTAYQSPNLANLYQYHGIRCLMSIVQFLKECQVHQLLDKLVWIFLFQLNTGIDGWSDRLGLRILDCTNETESKLFTSSPTSALIHIEGLQ